MARSALPPVRVRRSVPLGLATLLLAYGGLVACGGDDTAPDDPTETSDAPAGSDPATDAAGDPAAGGGEELSDEQVLEDFCTAAGLIKFMATGEDLQLWATSMTEIERPADLEGDPLAGLEIAIAYAASAPADVAAEEWPQPDLTDAEVQQLTAYSTYLEQCPQVTDPPSPTG